MVLDNLVDDNLYSGLIVYWLSEWDNLCDEVKKGNIGSKIINIRLLLNDIINEFELNKFKSDNNRKIYINIIEQLLKDKALFKFRNQLLLLKESLEEKNKNNSNREKSFVIAKAIQLETKNESIREFIFDEVFKILRTKDNSNNNRKKIKNLTFDLILDFVTEGFDIYFVKRFLPSFFDTYDEYEGKLVSRYKHVPKHLNEKELKQYIDNLSLEDRLKDFKLKLSTQKKEYTIVFPLYGLSILNSFRCLNFEILPSFVDEDYNFQIFLLPELISDKEVVASTVARIRVEAFSFQSAVTVARKELKAVLGLLNQVPRNGKYEVFTDGQYKGSASGNYRMSSISDKLGVRSKISKLSSSLQNPLIIDGSNRESLERFTTIFSELSLRNMNKEINVLDDVILLISETEQMDDEKALLNYWIILESLTSISKSETEGEIDFIKKFVSNISVHQLFSDKINNLVNKISFYYLRLRDKNQLNSNEAILIRNLRIDNPAYIPKEFNLNLFFEHLNDLKDSVSDFLLLDEITSFIEFKEDNKVVLDEVLKEKNNSILTIDYIYKSRNQIVHNGYVDQNIIPHVVNFSANYAKTLFNFILDSFEMKKYDLSSEFLLLEYNTKIIEKKLGENKKFEVYSIPTVTE